MAAHAPWIGLSGAGLSGSVEAELGKLRPARIRLALVRVLRIGVEVGAALRAQARALGPTGQLRRKRQGERVARPAGQVELPVADVGRVELLTAAGLVDLARVDREARRRRLEAAHA